MRFNLRDYSRYNCIERREYIYYVKCALFHVLALTYAHTYYKINLLADYLYGDKIEVDF